MNWSWDLPAVQCEGLKMMSVLLTILIFLAYYALKRNYDYWKIKGVPGPEPLFLFGNLWDSFLGRLSIGETLTNIYKTHGTAPFLGIFKSTTPCVLICEPKMLKEIAVKEFHSFHANDFDVDVSLDPIRGRNPFFINGESWKIVRTHLSPCFTGSKMKSIYPLIEDNSRRFVDFVAKKMKNESECLEAKELFVDYTINNVSSCAFGLEGRCFEDPNNEFKGLAKAYLSHGTWTMFKFFIIALIPPLPRFFPIKFTPQAAEERLDEIVRETMRYRRENNVIRNDFLHILNQQKESSKGHEFTDMEIAAHAAGFIADGYETSSVVMSFLLYEIAANPEAQEKLRTEINASFEKHDGKLPYEELNNMPYLDAVFNESQRMHPAVFTVGRRCTKPYTYVTKPDEGFTGPTVTIEEGTTIIIPIHGLQNDPKYYEHPDKFVPERWLGENKEKLAKYTYLPFGEGPRTCLGQKFGTLQVKAGIAYLIHNYEFSVNSKTQRPLKFVPTYLILAPVGGLWVNVKKIRF